MNKQQTDTQTSSQPEEIMNRHKSRLKLAATNLSGANFQGSDLSHSNFVGAFLREANFQGANLTGVNFENADLQGAILTGACLDKTVLAVGINHCHKVYNNLKISHWRAMRFRSQAEIKVAQALESRGLLYSPNCLIRLGNYHKSLEVDFLVCCPTRWGYRTVILEVDGYWHLQEKRAKEHERERMFERSGMRVHRFEASLCELDPHAVVSELIDLINI
jgi:very-short-patch-repair endonuclease